MIAHLEGIISEKTPTRIVLDVNGVGYDLLIPLTTSDTLNEIGTNVRLLTYLHVREDTLQLFGFSSPEEKSMFLSLITVSGVGPKLALGILSGCSVSDLRLFIAHSDSEALTKLPGLGKKTAQRLITELKDKFSDHAIATRDAPQTLERVDNKRFEEAMLALVALGFNKSAAQKRLAPIFQEEPELPIDELVKRVLQSR